MSVDTATRAVVIAAADWMGQVEHAAWLEWNFGQATENNISWLRSAEGPRPWRRSLNPCQVHLINCLEEAGAYDWEPPLPDQRPHMRVQS